MCKILSTQEKCSVGITSVFSPLASIYPWYSVGKNVVRLSVLNRITTCVCDVLSPSNFSCQTELNSVIGPGLTLTNVTNFCLDQSSNLNVAKSSTLTSIIYYSVIGCLTLGIGAGMVIQTIRTARKRSSDQWIRVDSE